MLFYIAITFHLIWKCFNLKLLIISSEQQELALYTSFGDEPLAEPCVFCGRNEENSIEFGKKDTYDDVTAHHFCLVSFSNHFFHDQQTDFCWHSYSNCWHSFLQILSANLKKKHNDDTTELFGYSIIDIKMEIARAAKLVCVF